MAVISVKIPDRVVQKVHPFTVVDFYELRELINKEDITEVKNTNLQE